MRTHQEIDARSLAMHLLVVEKIRSNPALVEIVQATLAQFRRTVCVRSQPYLLEWESLLKLGVEACLEVAAESSGHATALRQASPFTGILTNQERWAFLKKWKTDHEAY